MSLVFTLFFFFFKVIFLSNILSYGFTYGQSLVVVKSRLQGMASIQYCWRKHTWIKNKYQLCIRSWYLTFGVLCWTRTSDPIDRIALLYMNRTKAGEMRLTDYAKMHDKVPNSIRAMAARGRFKLTWRSVISIQLRMNPSAFCQNWISYHSRKISSKKAMFENTLAIMYAIIENLIFLRFITQ